jgi:energy-coupling factor transporter ATP-binding protein EcfA2
MHAVESSDVDRRNAMSLSCSPEKIREIFAGLIRMGQALIRPAVSNAQFQPSFDYLRKVLDWRGESPSEWARRLAQTDDPLQVREILVRLMWALHPTLRNQGVPKEQFLVDIGQVAWDLKEALLGANLPIGNWKGELEITWPRRPNLPRLEQVEINNFRCLKSVRVPLKPLTVLIGPNDSGKSAFLSAIECVIMGKAIEITDQWRGEPNLEVSILARSNVGEGRNRTKITDGQGNNTMPDLQPISSYHFPSQGIPMESPGYPDQQGVPAISNTGQNVPALFDYLLRQERDRYAEARDALKELIPGLQDINIGTPKPDTRKIDLLLEDGFRLPADRASTDVRLLLAFVALAYHPSPPRVILLEEPETGVHPKRLGDIMLLLREITAGKHGERAAQVILTTHSPYLLDCVDPATDQVLVFQRNPDGSRTANPADSDRLRVFLDEFKLGEVWYNQGEEGLVAMKP